MNKTNVPGKRVVLLLLLCTLPCLHVWAHPLGNYSINQYWLVDFREDTLRIFYLLDIAEVPTFIEMDKLDRNYDSTFSDEEIQIYLEEQAPLLLQNISVKQGERELLLRLDRQRLEIYKGTTNQPFINIFLDVSVTDWTPPTDENYQPVTLSSSNHKDAQGYREALIVADGQFEIGTGPWDTEELKYCSLVFTDEFSNPLFQSFYNVFRLELTPRPIHFVSVSPETPYFDWTATARQNEEMELLAQGEYSDSNEQEAPLPDGEDQSGSAPLISEEIKSTNGKTLRTYLILALCAAGLVGGISLAVSKNRPKNDSP